MRIGIIGSENTHTAAIAKTLNVDKEVPGFEVTHVWGETPEFAKKAAEEGAIPNIVENPTDMLGKVDAVLVDHRHGKYHLEAVRPFVEAGIPVFVDKPFTTDLKEGIAFVRMAKKLKVPITSYSAVSLQQSAEQFKADLEKIGPLRSLVTSGPVDIDSQWGGVFFYGIHQVDLICNLISATPLVVSTLKNGKDAVATITYDDGSFAVMHCFKEKWGGDFHASVVGAEGFADASLKADEKFYLTGIKRFCKMFETKVAPVAPVLYLRPVAILEAMQKSLETGRPVKVKKIPKL